MIFYETIFKNCFRWIYAEATVQNRADSWQLVFEGSRGNGYLGRIAIDDITIARGMCPKPGDCTFESKTYCGYSNVAGADFDWLLKSGPSGNPLG